MSIIVGIVVITHTSADSVFLYDLKRISYFILIDLFYCSIRTYFQKKIDTQPVKKGTIMYLMIISVGWIIHNIPFHICTTMIIIIIIIIIIRNFLIRIKIFIKLCYF